MSNDTQPTDGYEVVWWKDKKNPGLKIFHVVFSANYHLIRSSFVEDNHTPISYL